MDTDILSATLASANEYAGLGWRVIVLHGAKDGRCSCSKGSDCPSPAKHPRLKRWQEQATSDSSAIERWFTQWPASNLGVALGPISGLVDVEYDDAEGKATAERLLNGIPTPTFQSARSTHRLFRFPEGLAIPSAVVKAQGLEMRFGTDAKGAQSVFPPSVHASGVAYRWLDGLSPSDAPLSPFPEAIAQLIASPADGNGSGKFIMGADADGDLASHPGATDGQRNKTLCQLVGSFLKANGPTAEIVPLAFAWGARCQPPYPEAEVLQTVQRLVTKEQSKGIQAAHVVGPAVSLSLASRRYDTIEPRAVDWLWQSRFALGKLNLLVGEPGLGKTTVAIDIAARITRGLPFPDGAKPPIGEVAILTAEDGAEDTIRPRLDAAGADVASVHHIDCVRGSDGKERWLALDKHLPAIEDWLGRYPNVRLLIIDPIVAFIGDADSHRNAEMRAVLGPITKLAEQRNFALLGITHLAKSEAKAIHRVIGSIAFVAAARAAWLVGRDPDDDERRLFLPIKNNLAQSNGLAFTLESASNGVGRVAWDSSPVFVSADEIDDADQSPRGEAIDWLRGLLADGPQPSPTILARAQADGISEKTLRRAKKELQVTAKRIGQGWVWQLPDTPEADANVFVVE